MTVSLLDEVGARWRLTVHRRDFSPSGYAPARTTGIAEISDARSRRLELGWNAPGKLTFTVDGRSASAGYIQELTTEMMAWRLDPDTGAEALMFRGVVAQSEDTLSEQSHVVNFTAHDYLAVINRRYLTGASDLVYTQRDQDDVVADLLARAMVVATASGPGGAGAPVSFDPGSRLPVALRLVNPDGSVRAAKSGQLRDRTYTGGSAIGGLITDLAAVINGYDVDISPAANTDGHDWLRVWYPSRGVARNDLALVYGATVSSLTRSVNPADGGYANYIRVVGDNGGTEGAPQLIAEAWNADANNVGAVPVGLWMGVDSQSDVKLRPTLQQKADGDLATQGLLVPSYTVALRAGWYRPGRPALGDTVPLVVKSPPRLDVSATVRVLGLNFAIGDDGQEDVEVTVGRPAVDLTALFRKTRRDVDALARR
jgi:hypothetical protein